MVRRLLMLIFLAGSIFAVGCEADHDETYNVQNQLNGTPEFLPSYDHPWENWDHMYGGGTEKPAPAREDGDR